jgi:pyruvate/2-oxoglutarate dehydrogenase complex dihydrolipoamide acyltransferase (E2) component
MPRRSNLLTLTVLGLCCAGAAAAQAPQAAPPQAAPIPPQAAAPGVVTGQTPPPAPDLGGMHRQMVERRRAQEQMGVYNNLMALGLRRRDR